MLVSRHEKTVLVLVEYLHSLISMIVRWIFLNAILYAQWETSGIRCAYRIGLLWKKNNNNKNPKWFIYSNIPLLHSSKFSRYSWKVLDSGFVQQSQERRWTLFPSLSPIIGHSVARVLTLNVAFLRIACDGSPSISFTFIDIIISLTWKPPLVSDPAHHPR